MEEEVMFCIDESSEKMEGAVKHLESEFKKLRAGKADPHMLDGIYIDYYGTKSPVSQVANINTPDPRTISIQPWEKQMIDPIEKAILVANIGLTPMNNGELIRINIPMLTEERRKMLVKQVKAEGENTKVGIRNARRDGNDYIKKLKKDGLSEDSAKDAEAQIQKLTDKFIEAVDALIEKKEKEIMTI